MTLLRSGVDLATIALWLGHESVQTTHIYEHADPALKEEAIARTAPLGVKPGRPRPSDALLAHTSGEGSDRPLVAGVGGAGPDAHRGREARGHGRGDR